MIRLDLSKTQGFKAHRSGWSYCMNTLKPLHSNSGIFVDDFIERNFAWNIKEYFKKNEHNLPYKRQWIGFLHNPPNVPEWFDFFNSPQSILNRGVFKKSLETCKALVTLSDYLKNWLQPQVQVPVISVKHPTERPEIKWKPEYFFMQDKRPVIQLGYWLRKMFSICELQTGPKYNKIWLPSDKEYSSRMIKIEEKTKYNYWETKYKWSSVEILDFVSNEIFDHLLSRSIVFLDLYDSSANNAVVESIVRNTPLLINKIPAVVEYLGEDYPFYFESLEEAQAKLLDDSIIVDTYNYLSDMDKNWISGGYFARDLYSKLKIVL